MNYTNIISKNMINKILFGYLKCRAKTSNNYLWPLSLMVTFTTLPFLILFTTLQFLILFLIYLNVAIQERYEIFLKLNRLKLFSDRKRNYITFLTIYVTINYKTIL